MIVISSNQSTVMAQSRSLSIALLAVGEEQMAAYSELANKFESTHPNINLKMSFFSDEKFKQNIHDWLDQQRFDIYYWQAGDRLKWLINDNLLRPIDEVIEHQKIKSSTPENVLRQVRVKQRIYGLPFAHYGWGFYYNKQVFNKLNLSPPNDWQEFETILQVLKENKVSPFIQPAKEGWPLLAWVDYLALDVGGTKLRNTLLAKPRLALSHPALVAKLSTIFKMENFVQLDAPVSWNNTFAYLAREQAAMMLMGQFYESEIVSRDSSNIGYFPFPFSKTNNDTYTELAPSELFVIPSNKPTSLASKTFLNYMVDTDVRTRLAERLGWMTVTNADSQYNKFIFNDRTEIAKYRIKQAQRLVQYFDRETSPENVAVMITAMKKLMKTGNVEGMFSPE